MQARDESCSLYWSISADIVHRSPFYARTTPQSRRVRRQDRQLASHRAAGGRPRNTPYQTVPRSLSCFAECRSSRPSPRSRCRPSRRASCLHRRGRRVNTVSLDRMNAHSEGRAIVEMPDPHSASTTKLPAPAAAAPAWWMRPGFAGGSGGGDGGGGGSGGEGGERGGGGGSGRNSGSGCSRCSRPSEEGVGG